VDTEALASALLRPLAYAALIGLALAPLERVIPLRASTRRSFGLDAGFATLGGIAVELLQWVVGGALLALADRVGDHGPLHAMPALPRLVLALVIFELGGYSYHRLAHAWAPLFALHRVHHTSESMDWLAGFRQHPLEIALMTLFSNLPLVLLGMPLGAHAVVVVLLRIHTIFVHSNVRTPRALERVLATPRFHHRHHDRDGHHTNFASVFPWIDRLFGTHDARDGERFGIAPPG